MRLASVGFETLSIQRQQGAARVSDSLGSENRNVTQSGLSVLAPLATGLALRPRGAFGFRGPFDGCLAFDVSRGLLDGSPLHLRGAFNRLLWRPLYAFSSRRLAM